MDGLQPNWDAWVVDETLPAPNWRQVVKTEGTAYAVLPCDSAKHYFLGHPVMADNPAVKISLCNTLPGQWVITLHNPTDAAIQTRIQTTSGWTPFTLQPTTCTIPAGASVEIPVTAK